MVFYEELVEHPTLVHLRLETSNSGNESACERCAKNPRVTNY